MRFPIAMSREGWNGVEDRSRSGASCPVEPRFADTFGAARPDGRTHQGTDVFAGRGTVVRAPEAGTVRRAEGATAGKTVTLVADAGHRQWTFAHLDAYLGSTGRVAEGAPIGRVGDTGNAAGLCPHVHVELRKSGVVQNPYGTLAELSAVEARLARQGDAGTARELVRVLTAIGRAWRDSGVPEAESAAATLAQVVLDAQRAIEAGRPDAARAALADLLRIAESAPEEWRTPSTLLSEARRLVERAAPVLADVATGAGMGLGVGVVLAAGAAALLLLRK